MRILPCGDTAWMLDCDSLEEAQGWYAAAVAQLSDLVEDVVLGAQTVAVRCRPPDREPVLAELHRLSPIDPTPLAAQRTIQIAVDYDGEDLSHVAASTGLTVVEVIEAHTASLWTVAFGGFAPGFFYLVGGDPRLEVARRGSPRTTVPSGSVGLAGSYSGIYPRASPGGWQLIGRTRADLWDVDRDPPALLGPGMSVRFVRAS